MLALYPQNPERACPRLLPSPWGPCGLCGELGVCGWRRVKATHLERGNKRQRPGHPQGPRSGAPTVPTGVAEATGRPPRPYL